MNAVERQAQYREGWEDGYNGRHRDPSGRTESDQYRRGYMAGVRSCERNESQAAAQRTYDRAHRSDAPFVDVATGKRRATL